MKWVVDQGSSLLLVFWEFVTFEGLAERERERERERDQEKMREKAHAVNRKMSASARLWLQNYSDYKRLVSPPLPAAFMQAEKLPTKVFSRSTHSALPAFPDSRILRLLFVLLLPCCFYRYIRNHHRKPSSFQPLFSTKPGTST